MLEASLSPALFLNNNTKYLHFQNKDKNCLYLQLHNGRLINQSIRTHIIFSKNWFRNVKARNYIAKIDLFDPESRNNRSIFFVRYM